MNERTSVLEKKNEYLLFIRLKNISISTNDFNHLCFLGLKLLVFYKNNSNLRKMT